MLEGDLWYAESFSENNVARFTIVKKKNMHTHTIFKKKIRFGVPMEVSIKIGLLECDVILFGRLAHHFVGTLSSPSPQ